MKQRGKKLAVVKPYKRKQRPYVAKHDIRNFTDEQIRFIRTTTRSVFELADEYAVSRMTIYNIRKGVTYQDVK